MNTEIERKYLVRTLPDDLERHPGVVLRQGYLAVTDDPVVVRVREEGQRYVLAVKAGRGLVRTEVELPLSRTQFEALWPHTRGRRVEKTRYRVPVPGGTAELDVYHGALAGLRTVEVEFPTPEAAQRFRPPAWFGREVTDDPAYQNARLALEGLPADAHDSG
ncbi:MAG: adenylate cyclase [Bacteroidetes bacterium]|nr:MAG: adenylate cyclase [Bacteroidota bacterium]